MHIIEMHDSTPEVLSPKFNNFVEIQKGQNMKNQFKSFVLCETLLGINRLYLYDYRKWIVWFSYFICILITLVSACIIILFDLFNTTHLLYKDTLSMEYIFLSFNAPFQKKKLNNFFHSLQYLDDLLNIDSFIEVTTPLKCFALATILSAVYNIMEQILCFVFVYVYYNIFAISMHMMYIPLAAHDNETIFFCVLLTMILRRLYVIKAHVAKIFNENSAFRNEEDQCEALARKANLDISSLHRIYDLLHICSEELNRILNFPIIVMLIASAVSIITLLKTVILIFQYPITNTSATHNFYQAPLVFAFMRCSKNALLIVFPCYISNIIKTQVVIIRNIISDALNNTDLDKIERRKLKAFCQLAHERDFTYTLWGIIKMDMSLPLSYTSLVITYLIIVVQFSKFID